MGNHSGDEMDAMMQRLDRDSVARHERVRQVILAEGRPDLMAALDAKMRDIRLGIYGAKSCWYSISDAQRRTLQYMGSGGDLVRRDDSPTLYDIDGEHLTIRKAARLGTVRNLARRDLLAWDGGAFDPERIAVLTERGRFVLKHGRPYDVSTPPTPLHQPR